MSFAMSKAEREAFLAATHVGVISVAEEGRGPLTVPIWYRYEPGGTVRIVTSPGSRKAKLIQRAGRMSLCVQTETPPYQYVSVEGPAVLAGDPDYELDVRQVALRYLGKQMGEMYLVMTADERTQSGTVVVVLTPEHWLTVDYSKMV